MSGSEERLQLRKKYDAITDAMLQDEQGRHGVLLAGGVTDLGPFEQFKHLEFVKRGGGCGGNESYDVFVRKVPTRAHEIPPNVNTEDFGVWKRAAADALRALESNGAAVPVLETQSSMKDGRVLGNDVKAQVDWGAFPDLDGEVTPYRVIMETEVKNLKLKEMAERLLDYMASWPHVAVCVGVLVCDWHQATASTPRGFVSLGVVIRRNLETSIPDFERFFNLGTLNADGGHGKMISDLHSWARTQVDDKKMTWSVPGTDTSERTVVRLPQQTDTPQLTVVQLPLENYPLPEPRLLPTAIPEGLEDHYTVPVSAAELFYQCGLTETQLAEVPDFNINLYESRLKWNLLDADWNTRKRRRQE